MKDIWDKISLTVTTLLAIATVIIGIYTNSLSNELKKFEYGMSEEKMVAELVTSIATSDKVSNLKSDLTFLSLERYLRIATENGELKKQDENMLIGFAQSLVLARQEQSTHSPSGIKIPYEFLKKTNITIFNEFNQTLLNANENTNLPPVVVSDANMVAQSPIKTVIDESSTEAYSSILKRVVYIQYSNKNQKEDMKRIQDHLKEKSWIAPGIEFVEGNYSNTIKYFHDEDYKLALDLLSEVTGLKGTTFKPLRVSNFEKKVPKGQLEMWVDNQTSLNIKKS